ncbi:actin-related protein T2 [Nothoprocta perdicaria]|uniref:actin-related protein T2 n=1 Tax=Nothoprocta perdicaria TaxID=30464 RepID=UPI000E1B853A|nr:actin-related protein T2 [Nothoprocta perdicaria]
MSAAAVVVDSGSGQCKAGVAGERAPRSVIHTVVGYPKSKFVWRFLYKHELRMKPSEQPALLTGAPLSPAAQRESLAETMFEGLGVPALFVALPALTALYARARTTGLVLDSGAGVTTTVPVYEGHCLVQGIRRLDFAGRDVTAYLARLLLEVGHSFVSSAEREIVRDMKEKLCYVASDPRRQVREEPAELVREYLLPDGNAVRAGEQLFRAPEALFVPAEAGLSAPGVAGMLLQSVAKCAAGLQPLILGHVLLAGGSTLFPGFKERLLQELKAQIPHGCRVRIVAPRDRMCSAWIGASILASLTAFRKMWVTREDYNEVGPTVIQRKCF